MYHGASLRDAKEVDKITLELESTQESLKSTQYALQEFKIQIEQLHEEFPRSHCSSYPHMVDCIIDYMEETNEMVDDEVCYISYVLEETMDEIDEI